MATPPPHAALTRRHARWLLEGPDLRTTERLARSLDLASPVAALLANRGHREPADARAWLAASPMGLHDPMGLPDMDRAVERIARAIADGETILVHGDYDVDGITGTTILMRLFELVGAKAAWHIPNRMTDGYSFGDHSVERARAVGATLVVSVDNGTSAFETIRDLKRAGIDTVVTDHHQPPQPHPELGALPPAAAIVNPHLVGSTYPFPQLCGGAVAFKVAWALARHLEGEAGGAASGRVGPRFKAFLEDALAYVAIATLCDVVPLEDENRIFARAGLAAIANPSAPGLAALARVAGLHEKPRLGAQDVTFGIGPRLNASGRLGSADRAVSLLLAKDAAEAGALAAELDALNVRRREIEAEVLVAARAAAAPFADREAHPVLVLAGQGWHQGVVGIIAARLVEEFGRPAIVVGLDGDEGRGSARSVAGFDVLAAMNGATEHFVRHGGHAAAAGCEVRADRIDAVRMAVCAAARALAPDGIAAPPLLLDTDLDIAGVSEGLLHQLDRLEPYGEGNREPLFLARDLRLDGAPRVVGADRRHLILNVRRGPKVLKAIAFGQAHRLDELLPATPVHLACKPVWNHFRGRSTAELMVTDFQVGPLELEDPSAPS